MWSCIKPNLQRRVRSKITDDMPMPSRRGVLRWFVDWYGNYLASCKCTLTFGSATLTFWLDGALPQGSIMGPILFCFCIDPLLNKINSIRGCLAVSFVDDCGIIVKAATHCKLTILIRAVVRRCEEWARNFCLTFSAAKLAIMPFFDCPPVQAHLEGEWLENVKEYNYLGVLLDLNLTFDKHISFIISYASQWLPGVLLGA